MQKIAWPAPIPEFNAKGAELPACFIRILYSSLPHSLPVSLTRYYSCHCAAAWWCYPGFFPTDFIGQMGAELSTPPLRIIIPDGSGRQKPNQPVIQCNKHTINLQIKMIFLHPAFRKKTNAESNQPIVINNLFTENQN